MAYVPNMQHSIIYPGRKYKLPNSGLLLQVLSCIIKIKRIIREKRLRGSLVVLKNTLLDLLLLPRSFIKSSQIKLILCTRVLYWLDLLT